MPDPLDTWPTFAGAVRSRLEAGRAAYGDRSFAAEPAALVAELEQEALDLAGWGFVLWCRLRQIGEAAERLANVEDDMLRAIQRRSRRRLGLGPDRPSWLRVEKAGDDDAP
jgi:hypothetical protein